MKVVINNCFGGYNLSAIATVKLAERKGVKIFAYTSDREKGFRFYKKASLNEEADVLFWIKDDLGDTCDSDTLNKASWFHENDTPRHDKDLVWVVEELGKESWGFCAELKVVEIPDGTDYSIEEYDGVEHVSEAHRTWS